MCGQENGVGEEEKKIELEPQDEIEIGLRRVQKAWDPREPSEEERIEHEATNLPS